MRPSNLASELADLASKKAAQLKSDASAFQISQWLYEQPKRPTAAPQPGEFERWGATFAALTAHSNSPLHSFFSHEAVKLLKFLCRSELWFFTLVAEAVRQHGDSTDERITRANIIDALVAIQKSTPTQEALAEQEGNPIFGGDATDAHLVANVIAAAEML